MHFFLPQKAHDNNGFGVTMLLCRNDVLMATCCLQSLFYHLGYALPVYIVNDGSLRDADLKTLSKLFTITVEPHPDILPKMRKKYPKERLFLKYLQDAESSIKRLKLAALFLTPFRKTIFLEPDILFLDKPNEIMQFLRSSKNYHGIIQPDTYMFLVKKNWHLEFLMRRVIYNKAKTDSNYLLNGGLLLVNKETLKGALSVLKTTLEFSYDIEYSKTNYFEETLLSTVFNRKNSTVLAPSRYVTFLLDFECEYKNRRKQNPVCIHVTTPVRHLLYWESFRAAIATNCFRKSKG